VDCIGRGDRAPRLVGAKANSTGRAGDAHYSGGPEIARSSPSCRQAACFRGSCPPRH